MIVTDANGEHIFINTIELNVEDIISVVRNEDEDTVVMYKSPIKERVYSLDSDGHSVFCTEIQTRFDRLLNAGVIKDNINNRLENNTKAEVSMDRAIKVE